MLITAEDLCAHVASHAGVAADRVEPSVRAVLSGLGAYLSRAQRQLIADELPARVGSALFEAGDDRAQPVEERVLVPGMTAGQARELVASVCRVLAEELSSEALGALRTSVPTSVAGLLEGAAPEVVLAAADRPDSLASGRPGSHHPLAEARPRDRAQSGSVASSNPHGDTKLSSTHGTTQEREHETLAEGHRDETRKLSTSRS